MVLEDVAGLDGLHQAQVVGVNDGGGQDAAAAAAFGVDPIPASLENILR